MPGFAPSHNPYLNVGRYPTSGERSRTHRRYRFVVRPGLSPAVRKGVNLWERVPDW